MADTFFGVFNMSFCSNIDILFNIIEMEGY